MTLFTDVIVVELYEPRTPFNHSDSVAQTKTITVKGFKNAWKEAFEVLGDDEEPYEGAMFYTKNGEFLKDVYLA